MSSLKNRVAKLEAALLSNPGPKVKTIFLIGPGVDPTRCHYKDMEILREPGESREAFSKRCADTINPPGDDSRRIVIAGLY
jgi:hypothetical protein